MNDTKIREGLTALLAELDKAIEQAVENPLLFADGTLLAMIETKCAAFEFPDRKAERKDRDSALLESLAWEIRARAGRLQRLLDSASHFYTTCFSVSQCEGLAYGMQGEWRVLENPNHLTVDC